MSVNVHPEPMVEHMSGREQQLERDERDRDSLGGPANDEPEPDASAGYSTRLSVVLVVIGLVLTAGGTAVLWQPTTVPMIYRLALALPLLALVLASTVRVWSWLRIERGRSRSTANLASLLTLAVSLIIVVATGAGLAGAMTIWFAGLLALIPAALALVLTAGLLSLACIDLVHLINSERRLVTRSAVINPPTTDAPSAPALLEEPLTAGAGALGGEAGALGAESSASVAEATSPGGEAGATVGETTIAEGVARSEAAPIVEAAESAVGEGRATGDKELESAARGAATEVNPDRATSGRPPAPYIPPIIVGAAAVRASSVNLRLPGPPEIAVDRPLEGAIVINDPVPSPTQRRVPTPLLAAAVVLTLLIVFGGAIVPRLRALNGQPSSLASNSQPQAATGAAVSPAARPATVTETTLLTSAGATALQRLNDARGLTVDSSGTIYAVDAAERQVIRIAPTGQRLGVIGRPGEGDGQFVEPVAVFIDGSGAVHVLDAVRALVQVFSPTGQFQRQYGGDLAMYRPRGMTLGDDGQIYIADTGRNRVIRLSLNGALQGTLPAEGAPPLFEQPTAALEVAGIIYVVEPTRGLVHRLNEQGQRVDLSWQISQSDTLHSSRLDLGATGEVVITDVGAQRVLIVCPGGETVLSWPAPIQPVMAGLGPNDQLYVIDADGQVALVRLGQAC